MPFVANIMRTARIMELDDEKRSSLASNPDDPIVIVDTQKHTLAVFDEIDPSAPRGSVNEQVENSTRPLNTTPATPLHQIIRAMAYDKIPRWQVVREAGKIVGVVSPGDLERALQKSLASTAPLSKMLDFFGVGDTTPPATLCYVCPGAGQDPRHPVRPDLVQKKDKLGNPLCPDHGLAMDIKDPCPF